MSDKFYTLILPCLEIAFNKIIEKYDKIIVVKYSKGTNYEF